MRDFVYLAPETLEEAAALKLEHDDKAIFMAGATDVIIRLRDHLIAPAFANAKSAPVPPARFFRGRATAVSILDVGEMVPLTGLEPVTPSLRMRCSTS